MAWNGLVCWSFSWYIRFWITNIYRTDASWAPDASHHRKLLSGKQSSLTHSRIAYRRSTPSPSSTPYTFCGSTRRRTRRLRTTKCCSTLVWAASTCQPSTMRAVIFPLWNFSIGRALANLSASFYRFAAFLKKITRGLSRCIRCSKEISCPSSTTGST